MPIFIGTVLVVGAITYLLSLRIRWIGPRRRVLAQCIGLWLVAALAVIVTGDRTLGSVPAAIFLLGPALVGLCAWGAASAR